MLGLFVMLLIAHYLADFTHLSRPYMLKAKAMGSPWQPIFHHAAVHAFLMAVIAGISFGMIPALLAFIIELLTHFAIDTLKGRLNAWYPSLAKPTNPWHWYVFGADQMSHIMVIVLIIVVVNHVLGYGLCIL